MNDNELENYIGKYSTDKLLEIISSKAKSYSERFLDFSKNELVRRNVKFEYNKEHNALVEKLSDEELKKIVEVEFLDYNLEYMEAIRSEYLKRNFLNVSGYNDDSTKENKSKYPSLNILIGMYSFFGWVSLIVAAFGAFGLMSSYDASKVYINALLLIVGLFSALVSFATAEGFKLFIDIEKNTRNK